MRYSGLVTGEFLCSCMAHSSGFESSTVVHLGSSEWHPLCGPVVHLGIDEWHPLCDVFSPTVHPGIGEWHLLCDPTVHPDIGE